MNFANVSGLMIPVNGVNKEVLSITDSLNRVIWQKNTIDYSEPFYVYNMSGNVMELLIQASSASSHNIDVEYSYDGEMWYNMGNTGSAFSSGEPLRLTLDVEDKVYLRASTTGWGWFSTQSFMPYYNVIYAEDSFGIGGNILSLLYGEDFNGQSTFDSSVNTYTFYNLFNGAPVVDASELILPTNTIGSCYNHMFYSCSSLNSIKCLATDISASNCLSSWVYGVAATGTFTKKTGVTYPSGSSGIPSGWTVVNV